MSNVQLKSRYLHTPTLISAMLLAFPAVAQKPQKNTDTPHTAATLDTIVVTAQRRSQRVQDVPVSISVVPGDQLVRSGITHVTDLSQRLPNVKITSGGNADFINVRGVGSGNNPGFEQSVATFVDGVYRGRSRATRAALFDIDRVEILKGPQTTFFGNNAIAGALNITTRKPDHELDYNISAAYGSYNEYLAEGGASVPVSKNIAVRFAGRFNGSNGAIKNTFLGRDEPRNRERIGRIALNFTPNDRYQSDLRFDIGRSRINGSFAVEFLNCPAGACNPVLAETYGAAFDDRLNKRSAMPESYTDYDFKESAWSHSIDFGGVSLSASTGYFQHEFTLLTQQIPAPIRGVGGGGLLPIWVTEEYESFSQELRLQSASGGRFEWMLGAYYLDGDLKPNLYTGFRFPVETPNGPAWFGDFLPGVYTSDSPITVEQRTTQKETTKSAFASLTLRPLDELRVNLGLRYSIVDKTSHRYISFGTSNADPSVNFVPGGSIVDTVYGAITGTELDDFAEPSRSDHKLMPAIGLQYDFSRDMMGYLSYTKGFKAGGFGYSVQADTFNPESVNAYEIGLKTSLFDRSVTANLALFWSDYSDLQESTTLFLNGQVTTIINNAAQARARGIETGLSWAASPNLSLFTEIAWLDARYLSYPNASCTIAQNALSTPPCNQDMSGQRRAFAPRFSGSIGASIRFAVSTMELRIDPLVYFTSPYFITPSADPLLRQSGNAKFDLRIGIGPNSQKWELAIIGRNITDRLTSSLRGSASFPGSTYAMLDPVRTLLMQFTLNR